MSIFTALIAAYLSTGVLYSWSVGTGFHSLGECNTFAKAEAARLKAQSNSVDQTDTKCVMATLPAFAPVAVVPLPAWQAPPASLSTGQAPAASTTHP